MFFHRLLSHLGSLTSKKGLFHHVERGCVVFAGVKKKRGLTVYCQRLVSISDICKVCARRISFNSPKKVASDVNRNKRIRVNSVFPQVAFALRKSNI